MKKLPLIVAMGLTLAGCTATGEMATEKPAAPGPVEASQDEKTAKPEESTCEASWGTIDCQFGQTALYEDSRRNGDIVKLELTVQEPQTFTPDKDADYAIATLGGDTEPGPDNLFFDITIKNVSEEVVLDDKDIQIVANSTADSDFDVRYVHDSHVDSFWDAELKPGMSAKMRSGWNFTDATDPEFSIRVDGLGGNTAKFTYKE